MKIPPSYFVFALGLIVSVGALRAERQEPVLGAEIIDRLIAPETRSQAFREVQIAMQDDDPHQDWRELPMAAFELYHQDILVTECPQLNGAVPLYMVSYLWDYQGYLDQYSGSAQHRVSGFEPIVEAHKPEHLQDHVEASPNWQPALGNPTLSIPPKAKLEERVIIFLTGEGAGRYLAVRPERPLPERYPSGDYRWNWISSQRDPDRVLWFKDTLWWLAQLRSNPKVREEGHRYSSTGMTSNCFPTYMETTPPSIRLLSDQTAVTTDIRAERSSPYPNSWRDGYGPEQYLGFVEILHAGLERRTFREREQTLTIGEVFASVPSFVEELAAGRLPPQLAKEMIRSAGDSGDVTLLPLLEEVEAQLPEPTDFELEWAQLQTDLSDLSSEQGVDAYRKRIEIESKMAALEEKMRGYVWAWLREPLTFAIAQLKVADDVEVLQEWAAQPGQPEALWALSRLKEVDVEAWRSVLIQVFLEQPDWRTRIMGHAAYKDRELADRLYQQLPRKEQLAILPSYVGNVKAREMQPDTVEDLLATVQSADLPPVTRDRALDHLVPDRDLLGIESVQLDRVLLEVFEQELETRVEPWPERYLVHKAARSLILRDQIDLPIEPYIKAAELSKEPFSFMSYLDLIIHLANAITEPGRYWLCGMSRML